MIQLHNVFLSYQKDATALNNISLRIAKGEFVFLTGPSGAGKTTLLQIMGTLDKADAGTVILNGTEVNRLKEKELSAFRNQQIGFVFQFHQLLPEFTALENVMIPAFISGASSGDAMKRAKETLDFLGLAERASHKPAELSGGEKQRVAIASTLVYDTQVIFFDEPSAGLDPVARQAWQWFVTEVPQRSLHNWQNAAARLIAADLRSQSAVALP